MPFSGPQLLFGDYSLPSVYIGVSESELKRDLIRFKDGPGNYSDLQKSVPAKLARLSLEITIGYCFDSHPRIDSVLKSRSFATDFWRTL